MEEKKHCKWYDEEFCTNDKSPCVADFCPVVEYPELCKCRELDKDINVRSKDDTEIDVGMLEEALVDTLKEVAIKFSKDSYICRVLADTINFIHRLQSENEQLMERVFDCTAVIEYNEKCSKEIQAATILLEQRNKEIAEQKAEIERLNGCILTYAETLGNEQQKNAELQTKVDKLKAENAILNKQVDRNDKAIVREMNIGYKNERQAVKDTTREILQGFNKWLKQAISDSYDKSVKGSAYQGGRNNAFHEVKELVKRVAESKGVEVE